MSWVSFLGLKKQSIHICKSVRESLACNCLIVPQFVFVHKSFIILLRSQEINWLLMWEYIFIKCLCNKFLSKYMCMCKYVFVNSGWFSLTLLYTPPQKQFGKKLIGKWISLFGTAIGYALILYKRRFFPFNRINRYPRRNSRLRKIMPILGSVLKNCGRYMA